MIPHDHEAIAAMQDHAVTAWPEESLGVLVRRPGLRGFERRLEYRRLRNVAPDPRSGFEGEPGSLEGAAAVIHSHPSGASFPSREDLESQIAAGVPYGVVPVATTASCGAPVAGEPFFWPDRSRPYLARPYRHGVTDCYTLVRDWYERECGIELPAVAYDWRWDVTSPELDLYSSSRRRLGWRRIEPSSAQVGDLVLLAMGGAKPANHAGVLLEAGQLLHHPSLRPCDPTSLSRRTAASRLARHVVEVARPPGREIRA